MNLNQSSCGKSKQIIYIHTDQEQQKNFFTRSRPPAKRNTPDMDNKQQQQERSQDSFILHHSNPNGFDLPNIEANYFNCAAKFNMTPYKSWPSWVGRRKKFSAENSCVQQHIRVQPGASSSCEERKQAASGLCAARKRRPSVQASLKQLFSRGKKLKHKI